MLSLLKLTLSLVPRPPRPPAHLHDVSLAHLFEGAAAVSIGAFDDDQVCRQVDWRAGTRIMLGSVLRVALA